MSWLESLNSWEMSPEDGRLLDLVCELARRDRHRACREWHLTYRRSQPARGRESARQAHALSHRHEWKRSR